MTGNAKTGGRRRGRFRRVGGARAAGFTLIELLTAMAILVVIVLVVSQLFQQSSMAWESGTRSVVMAINGRAAVSFMARELEQSVRGGPFENVSIGEDGRSITFVSLGNRPEKGGPRAASKVRYTLNGDELRREVLDAKTGSAKGQYPVWGRGPQDTIIDNVRDVWFEYYPRNNTTNAVAIDISMLLRPEKDSPQRFDRVYESRVYFPSYARYY